MSEAGERIGFIRVILPLQLRMAICYQYESAYFPAPYADNQLFSLGGGGGGGAKL